MILRKNISFQGLSHKEQNPPMAVGFGMKIVSFSNIFLLCWYRVYVFFSGALFVILHKVYLGKIFVST